MDDSTDKFQNWHCTKTRTMVCSVTGWQERKEYFVSHWHLWAAWIVNPTKTPATFVNYCIPLPGMKEIINLSKMHLTNKRRLLPLSIKHFYWLGFNKTEFARMPIFCLKNKRRDKPETNCRQWMLSLRY